MKTRSIVTVLVSTACVATSLAFAQVSALDTPSRGRGVGETILLVVADVTAPGEAEARRDALNARFGPLDGFSVDATDGYELRAALVQTSRQASKISCKKNAIEMGCPAGRKNVLLAERVKLRHVPKKKYASFADPSPCGNETSPPCQGDRFRQLFGHTLELPRGRSIVTAGFRTRKGAEEFLAFARTIGVQGLVTVQAFKRAGGDVGLGQEARPDGSGPLEDELEDQEVHQR